MLTELGAPAMEAASASLDTLNAIDQLTHRLYSIHPAGFQSHTYLEQVWCPPRIAALLYHEGQELHPTGIEYAPGFPPLHCLSKALQNFMQHPEDRVPYFGLAVYGNHDPATQERPLQKTIWWPHYWVMCGDGKLLDTAELSPTPHYVGLPFGPALYRAVEATKEHPIYHLLETRLGLWHLCR